MQKKVKNGSGKDFFKLMKNATFEKKMESVKR